MEQGTENLKQITVEMSVTNDQLDTFMQKGYVPISTRDNKGRITKVQKATFKGGDKEDVSTQIRDICCDCIDTGLRILEEKNKDFFRGFVKCVDSLNQNLIEEMRLTDFGKTLREIKTDFYSVKDKIYLGVNNWEIVELEIIKIRNAISNLIIDSVNKAFIPSNYNSSHFDCVFKRFDYVPPFWRDCIDMYRIVICWHQKITMNTLGVGIESQKKLEIIFDWYNEFLGNVLDYIEKYENLLSEKVFNNQVQVISNQRLFGAQRQDVFFVIPRKAIEGIRILKRYIIGELRNGTSSSMTIKYEDKILKLELLR